ncbi:GIY-YIG nuclease family protein [Streptomyces sp. NPDC054887]
MTQATEGQATALYRLYDSRGDLLYVGIANNPTTRWSYHAGEKTWWPQVARRTVEWFPLRAEAEQAETATIIKERPRYNVTHSPTRKPGDARKEDTGRYGFVAKVRAGADLWHSFGRATEAAGTNRSAAIVAFIRWYLRRPSARLPKRPAVGPWSVGSP